MSLKIRVAAVQMLRTCCLMCSVEEAHSSLPQTMEHPSHALPWGSALCWPNVPCHECGMDGPEELQSSSFPQIFWESSVLETFERRGEYFRGDSSTGTPFPFHFLGKAWESSHFHSLESILSPS